MTKATIEQVSTWAALLAILFFVGAVAQFFSNRQKVFLTNRSSIIERDAAIERAQSGNSDYSFSTNFLPGVGQPTSPDQTRKSFKEANPEAFTN